MAQSKASGKENVPAKVVLFRSGVIAVAELFKGFDPKTVRYTNRPDAVNVKRSFISVSKAGITFWIGISPLATTIERESLEAVIRSAFLIK